MLIYILLSIPLVTIITTIMISSSAVKTLRILNFISSIITLLYSLFFILGGQIKNSIIYSSNTYFSTDRVYSSVLTFGNALTIDGISMLFIILTSTIFPLCFLSVWNIKKNIKELLICLQILEVLTFIVFMVQDIFLFYIFFEIILIPMFYIIINWGPNDRKVKAAFYFFIYTFIGSILLLFAIFFIYNEVGSTNFSVILSHSFSYQKQICLIFLLFFSFAIKIPMFPFHLWLPEAHVEAPTVGSVILAALLLKLGSYGLIRIVVPIGIHGITYLQPMIFMLCLLSLMYASIMAIRQIDLKRIIAYSSIAHMNLSLLGVFTVNLYGIAGGVILMIAHGITSAALFLSIGVIYDRYHTRLLKYYSGLASTMPIFIAFFFFFNSANFSLPGTFNFIGELFTLFSLSESNSFFILIISAFTSILGITYSLLLVNKISFGYIKINFIKAFNDVTRLEIIYLLVLSLIIITAGFFPTYLFSSIESTISSILLNLKLSRQSSINSSVFYLFLLKIYNSGKLEHINHLHLWTTQLCIRIPRVTWLEWVESYITYDYQIKHTNFQYNEGLVTKYYIYSENISRWVYTECVLFLFNTPPSGIRIIINLAQSYINIHAYDTTIFEKWVTCKIYNRAILRSMLPTSFEYFVIQTNLLSESARVLENIVYTQICDDIKLSMPISFWDTKLIGAPEIAGNDATSLLDEELVCTPAGCYVPDEGEETTTASVIVGTI